MPTFSGLWRKPIPPLTAAKQTRSSQNATLSIKEISNRLEITCRIDILAIWFDCTQPLLDLLVNSRAWKTFQTELSAGAAGRPGFVERKTCNWITETFQVWKMQGGGGVREEQVVPEYCMESSLIRFQPQKINQFFHTDLPRQDGRHPLQDSRRPQCHGKEKLFVIARILRWMSASTASWPTWRQASQPGTLPSAPQQGHQKFLPHS